jgi:hypothetical protein
MNTNYTERNLTNTSALIGPGALIAGVGVGLVAGYLLDPDRGRRRRAVIGDQLASAGRSLPGALRVTARDISNRAHGAPPPSAIRIK